MEDSGTVTKKIQPLDASTLFLTLQPLVYLCRSLERYITEFCEISVTRNKDRIDDFVEYSTPFLTLYDQIIPFKPFLYTIEHRLYLNNSDIPPARVIRDRVTGFE